MLLPLVGQHQPNPTPASRYRLFESFVRYFVGDSVAASRCLTDFLLVVKYESP
jgi:hypothetical protein